MATYYWIGGNGTWNGSNTTNWSLTSGGLPGVAVPGAADTVVFDSASGTGTCTTASGSACATATLNSSTLALTLGANHTMSGTFTLTLGTLTLASYTLSCNIFNTNNSNTRTIAFGSGNITLTGNAASIWVSGTQTGLSVTGTPLVKCTYSGATGTRTISSALTSSGGTESNAISFSITAGTDIVTFNNQGTKKSIDFTGFSGTLTNSNHVIYGSLTLSSGMTLNAGTSPFTFSATSGTNTITTNNKSIDQPITFDGVGGTWQLQDNLTTGSTRTVTLTNGTLDLNNQTLSCGIFSSSNSNARSIAFGTGNITLTGSGATIWNGTGSTNTAIGFTGTPTVNCTYAGSTGTRTISGGSRTVLTEAQVFNFNITAGSDTISFPAANAYGNLDFTGFTGTLTTGTDYFYGNLKLASGQTWTATTSALTFAATSAKQITTSAVTIDVPMNFNGVGGTWAFQDALTQGSTKAFTITNGTVKLKAGATSTVGAFATSGSNQKYLQSTTVGSQATLSQASGTVTVTYLTIQDITATGGATWNAFLTSNNVNAGNNTGWDWYYEPGEYMYTRRKTKRLLIQ